MTTKRAARAAPALRLAATEIAPTGHRLPRSGVGVRGCSALRPFGIVLENLTIEFCMQKWRPD